MSILILGLHVPTKGNFKKHYFMSSICVLIGLPCAHSCEHWEWFQDYSFFEI